MRNTKKKLNNQSRVVRASFTGSNITKYSGLNTVAKYINRQNIVKSISTLFPTQRYNTTKFGVNQILAAGLHELFKRRSVSETWIEQVKDHTMAGTTLTDNFWANDIHWQLNVLAFNLSVMMRQKKSKFKKQEHRTFFDWFIAVPAIINSSGHQIEMKMFSLSRFIGKHHFYKADWEELDQFIEAA